MNVSESWYYLIKSLKDTNSYFDIFSTNYDAVIESAFGFVYDDKQTAIFQGIKGLHRRELDLTRWKEPSPEVFGLLTKLHGSIDWKIQDGAVFSGDAVFTGDHTKQAIIYPGFKGRSSTTFFSQFHEYLESKVSAATDFVFIGFAFRDEYINDIIQSNISGDSQVIVINPSKLIKFPAKRQRRVKHIHSYFDRKSIETARDLLKL